MWNNLELTCMSSLAAHFSFPKWNTLIPVLVVNSAHHFIQPEMKWKSVLYFISTVYLSYRDLAQFIDMTNGPAWDSNQWSLAYQANALPTELLGLTNIMNLNENNYVITQSMLQLVKQCYNIWLDNKLWWIINYGSVKFWNHS